MTFNTERKEPESGTKCVVSPKCQQTYQTKICTFFQFFFFFFLHPHLCLWPISKTVPEELMKCSLMLSDISQKVLHLIFKYQRESKVKTFSYYVFYQNSFFFLDVIPEPWVTHSSQINQNEGDFPFEQGHAQFEAPQRGSDSSRLFFSPNSPSTQTK